MSAAIHITAPSRLHFGLWSLGGAGARQFGGVGVMIDQPALRLSVREAASFSTEGHCAESAAEYAGRWAVFHQIGLPHCRVTIEEAIPQHAGLGSGTQLALAVAAGLNAFVDLPSQTPQELAFSVGRGLRSAVGTYGFVFGGLVVEQGKLPDEPISPLDCRIDLPDEWRFVLLRPRGLVGIAGREETEAFAALAAVSPYVTEELIAETRERLVPAAATADYPMFAKSLYHYGHSSGEIFAARQGGPYNGPVIAGLIEDVRRRGFEGVGQSSWGPTVYVVTRSDSEAARLAEGLRDSRGENLDVLIASPANHGARIEVAGGRTVEQPIIA
jgi:beta-ribofuranosylaminobenzene 5'-phosphate synthase